MRIAAHKEIQAILHKKRGIRRLREWVAKTTRDTARKVTPKPLHKVLGVQAKSAPSQARAKGTPAPLLRDMPKQGLRAPGGYGQTTADLKERAKAPRTQAPPPGPQRQQARPQAPTPARMQAGTSGRGKTIGTPAPTLQQSRGQQQPPGRKWFERPGALGPEPPARVAGSVARNAPADPWDTFAPRRDAAAKDRPAPVGDRLPSEVSRESRPSRIRLPRLIRARS